MRVEGPGYRVAQEKGFSKSSVLLKGGRMKGIMEKKMETTI